jgi:hypothetical protein
MRAPRSFNEKKDLNEKNVNYPSHLPVKSLTQHPSPMRPNTEQTQINARILHLKQLLLSVLALLHFQPFQVLERNVRLKEKN